MMIQQQRVIPAARSIKDFEWLMKTNAEYVVLLDVYISQLVYLRRMARDFGKKLLLHADLVQGLRHDEAAAQFLCQVIKPAGLISTHSNVVLTAKKHGLISIQRIFLLDSHSLDTSYRVMNSSDPDYIEVLPGMMPEVIREVSQTSRRPVLAGGFIRNANDVETILRSGATAVTTSSRDVWNHYLKKA
ncbi:glycerol uptake operon antiterminator regulatory protein [Alicyclobacillus contaminans]|uniref:glycerol-3-phosphate responsive antiterminator n=1 Tax=Alicyclobacillus contaminans TaxID=392016 RepID=UPI00040A8442|nr:glycerol-3-phosphate responsive antiterminator [Alicyclobacillus contaminans]GMA51441.1 glycerol uptake operon antiterminator regulatory protein [Alicyclobacillus contaminans]